LPRRRPNLNLAIRALLEDIVRRMPEFAHVNPARVLVVAGEARRASRGTVKPLAFAGGKSRDAHGHRKPIVKVQGARMLYCITLRPLFFRDSSPQERVETVIHELFHVSPKFDGTLDRRRRHERMGARFGRKLRPLVRRYLKECPADVLVPFAYEGEVRIHQWLERPSAYYVPTGKGRRVYTEKHLFLATLRMLRTVSPLPRRGIH
jgi:predicted metallopeptidase